MMLTIRLKDKTVKGKLKKLAQAERRPLNSYLNLLLEAHVKKQGNGG